MNIQDHVPQLETCKRRKELGLSQESEFIWWKPKKINRPFEVCLKGYQIHPRDPKKGQNEFIEWYSAPLASETLNRLKELRRGLGKVMRLEYLLLGL